MRLFLPLKALNIGALAGVLLTGFPSHSVRAETMSYSPESCASPAEGMVYLAFDRIVLRIPAEELTVISDLPAKYIAKMPKPPNPGEPEGCPDHPIQAASFTFSYLYEAIRKNKRDPELPPYAPSKLKLISSKPDSWGLQLNAERFYQRICELHQQREKLANGLNACLTPLADKSRPRKDWAVHLQADRDLYSAPFGRPFVVACYPTMASGSQDCQVKYKLYETLNVAYEVSVQQRYSDQFVPLEEIIEFDRNLRAKIGAARVVNFDWPDLK